MVINNTPKDEIEFDTNLEAWQQMLADEKQLIEAIEYFMNKYSSFIMDTEMNRSSGTWELNILYDGQKQRQFLKRIQSRIGFSKNIT